MLAGTAWAGNQSEFMVMGGYHRCGTCLWRRSKQFHGQSIDASGEFLYYTRAWCCVEALLLKTLEKSCRRHRRYENLLINPKCSEAQLVDARSVGDQKPRNKD